MDTQKNSGYKNAKQVICKPIEIYILFIIAILTLYTLKYDTSLLYNDLSLGVNFWCVLSILFLPLFLRFVEHSESLNTVFLNSFEQHITSRETFQTSVNNKQAYEKSYSKKDAPSNATNKRVSIPYLDEVFDEFEDDYLHNAPIQTISILSYFATSLFEKNNVNDVLWDIVENCISHLHLEDCVIYMLDKEKQYLIQKAAFGNKNNGEKKIISPIKIKKGKGIVGNVAESGRYQRVNDVSKNSTYIIDDASRMSELSVPICIEGTVIGVLDSEHSEKNYFTNDHVFLFHLIAKLTEKKLKQICSNSTPCNITNDNSYYKELEFLMKEVKIYRNPNLGLESVAKKLKISSNYLSQLVNKLTGKNFADYINTFRVEDAKLKLRNVNFINYTIVGIALESGFNSKSTFYSAFKKIAGISPSIYRKKI
ncbi:helix-turn-helix domain-containing protein [Aquimarina sp. 2201CG14-23]|uniref:helix-turn-helix domain-containing protein n=1 Tax=Aquimarina mycalae TaxID=3040073 RepID=UPI002477D709|nr:helix-turn-helix domain-containing protein [Aquimarina sp. 2201CG14-23]MDH7446257.1 helix-turn-helix domain-containing protein [Aquimarina sp. 2201CG14-23]